MGGTRKAFYRCLTRLRRFVEEVVDLVFSLTLVILATLTIVLALIQTRPVSIAFLMPYVWPAIERHLQDTNVDYRDVTLQWPADDDSLDLRILGLAGETGEGAARGTAKTLALHLNVRQSFTSRTLVLDDLDLEQPVIDVAMPAGNEESSKTALSDEQAKLEEAVQRLGRIAAAAFVPPDGQKIQLRQAHAHDLQLILTDEQAHRRLMLGPAQLAWTADGGGAGLTLDTVLDRGRIRGQFRPVEPSTGQVVALDIQFDGIVPAPLAAFAGFSDAASLEAPLSGKAGLTVSADGRVSPIRFVASTERTNVRLDGIFEGPVAVDRLTADGSFDIATMHLKLDQAALNVGSARLDVALDAELAAKGRQLSLSLKGRQIDNRMLTAYWPLPIVPQVREWLQANLLAGRAENASLEVDWKQRPPDVPDDVKLNVTFDAAGVAVSFLDGFPAVEQATGTGKIDEHGMHIDVRSGRLDRIAVGPGKLDMAFMPKGQPDILKLQAQGQGELPAALAVVQRLPMLGGHPLPIQPRQTRGRGTANLVLELPLADDIAAKDVKLNVDAQLQGVAITNLQPGLDLTDGRLALQIDRQALQASGTGKLDGVAANIERVWTSIDPDDHRPLEATVTVAIDQQVLRRYEISPSLATMTGTVPARIEVVAPAQGDPDIRIDADLTPAGIEVPSLSMSKPRGRPGRARFGLRRNSLETHIDNLDLITPDIEVDGDIVLTMDEHLKSLNLTSFVYGLTRLSAKIENKPITGYVGTIKAGTLDLRPFLGGTASGTAKTPASSSGSGGIAKSLSQTPPLDLSIEAGELILPGGAAHKLRLHLQRSPGAWRLIDFKALLPSGSPISGRLTQQAGGSPFTIESNDAGAVLTAIDKTARFTTGGKLRVTGHLTGESPLRLNGDVQLHDFTVERAPVLAQILTLASFTGILNTLQGHGIFFDRGRVRFDLDQSHLRLADGLVHGSQLGFTFDGNVDLDTGIMSLSGTVIPAYTINRIIGQIPLLGRLMRGARGVGAFAVTFWADGPMGNPSVGVNPLSLIVPGVVRDLMSEMGRPAR